MNNITDGMKVWARINGKKIPATILEHAFSPNGDYFQCKVELEVENPLEPGQVIKQVYPRPIQSYKLTHRFKANEKPPIQRSKRQRPAEVLKEIESLIRQN